MEKYGICVLSIVPVRAEPSDKSELSTQLLFGDAYVVIEESDNKKWLKIRQIFDEYEGWIDAIQHHEVTQNYFEAFVMSAHPVLTEDVAWLDNGKKTVLATLGSQLPFLQANKCKIGSELFQYEGFLQQVSDNLDEETIKFVALRFLNVPYLWGGKTLFGIDCSGYTQQVYKILGYHLKRDAYQQAEHGELIRDLKETKIGDLAFFKNDSGKISHVGMMLEKDRLIHSHGFVRVDVIDEKGIFNANSKKYSHNLAFIKRIIHR
jgi:gamma-D-glutamyl-L-lysine dipeptidyl-peptidase